MPVKAIKWLLMQHSPLVIWPMLDPAMWRWGATMLANCTASAYELNKSRMVPLAEYSRDCLKALRAETGIRYDERAQGTLQLFRTQKQLDGTAKDIEILKQYGVPYEVLDRDGCVAVEPALAPTRDKFVGALRLPGDETGDCFQFTQRLAEMAAALGVQLPLRHHASMRLDRRRRPHHRRAAPTRRHADAPIAIVRRARQLFAAAAEAARHPPAGLSGQGLLDHGADHRRRAARPSRRSWTRRTRSRSRAWATASASAARPSWPATTWRCARRGARTLEHVVTDLFPRGGDVAQAELLVRPAADDARRHADRRPDAAAPTCSWPPATARSAGPWPPAPAA